MVLPDVSNSNPEANNNDLTENRSSGNSDDTNGAKKILQAIARMEASMTVSSDISFVCVHLFM